MGKNGDRRSKSQAVVQHGAKGLGQGKRLMVGPSGDLPAGSGAAGAGPSGTHNPNEPLEINSRIECKWRDGQYHMARIIERRQNADTNEWEYYVHYNKLNRRMDEWVETSQLNFATLDTELVGKDDRADDKSGRSRGNQKRKAPAAADESHSSDGEGHSDFDPNQLREHEEFTKVKNIGFIELGRFEMETWYFSPFPAEFNGTKKLYVAEYDLAFFKSRDAMLRHLRKCTTPHPPGDEIYRKDNISMFEVDGKKEKIYCQNLCYLAKLFLDHKTLYYDVDLFLFYILCETDERGAHIVGYFSKEKCSEEGYNLACILTLPCYQRKGYGKFLIQMSYELSKIEGKVGTPERPLSDLGQVSYRGYWTRVLLPLLLQHDGAMSIQELSDMTCIKVDDIISQLQLLGLIQYQKGQHVLVGEPELIKSHLAKAGSPGLEVDPSKIVWTPYNAERDYQNYRN